MSVKPAKYKDCFIGNDDCSSEILAAHILSMKATMSLVHGPDQKNQRKVVLIGHNYGLFEWEPKEVGWKSASTHHCFCGKHDNKLFEPIENDNIFDPKNIEHLFLQSLRSFAVTYYKKKIELKPYHDLLDFEETLDQFKFLYCDPDRTEKVSDWRARINLQFWAYEKTRKELLEILDTKAYSKMQYITRVLDYKLPFASAGSLIAENVDPLGAQSTFVYYDNKQPVVRKPALILTVMPVKTKQTIIVLAGLKSDFNTQFELKKYRECSVLDFEKAISKLMLTANKENTFFNPQLWYIMKHNNLD